MDRAAHHPQGTPVSRARWRGLSAVLSALALLAAPVSARAATGFNTELASTLSAQARGIWGWSDGTREYALVCRHDGLWVVDCTNPAAPVLVADIPSQGSGFIEVRTYGNYAYAVNNQGPIQIIDLSDPANIHQAGTFNSAHVPGAHTLEIDGHYAYLCLWGVGPRDVRILDLADPLQPQEVGFWRHPDMPPYAGPATEPAGCTGCVCSNGSCGCSSASGDGVSAASATSCSGAMAPTSAPRSGFELTALYQNEAESGLQSHDCYVRGDRMYVANVLGGFAVVDVSDKTNPRTLALMPYTGALCHSMWLSDDGKYLFTTDEKPGGHLRVWNVANPQRIQQKAEFETAPGRMIHNVVVRGEQLYAAYYTDGLRVLDISNPLDPVEIAYYDTYQGPDGGYTQGAWGAYPAVSGHVFVSDMNSGLFVVAVDPALRAGRVTGFVSDASGQTLSDASVRFLHAGRTVATDVSGYYEARVGEGPHWIVTEKYGFRPDTAVVYVPRQGNVAHPVTLTPLPFSPLRVKVTRPGGAPVPGAAVRVKGLPNERLLTDAAGIADYGSVPRRDYLLEAGSLGGGFATRLFDVPASGSPEVGITLPGVIFDDADADQGWSLGVADDNATSGAWVRDDPNVHWGWWGQPSQVDWDAGGATRGRTYHTGYGLPNGSQDLDDVDGGRTTLLSPPFALDGWADPVLAYSRWFSKDTAGNANEPDDKLQAEISADGGATWRLLEEVTSAPHTWVDRSFRVRDFVVPTAAMKLRFVAQDLGGDTIVEAAIDRVAVRAATVDAGPASGAWLTLEPPAPHPCPAGRATIAFRLARDAARCRVDLVDVRGRVVTTVADGPRAAGAYALPATPKGSAALRTGLYWIRVEADGQRAVRKMVVIAS